MNMFELLKAELKAILTNKAILLTVIGGALLYSFMYPQPYIKQMPTEQKIALIDLDNTPLSRKLARAIDATPQVKIVFRLHDEKSLKKLISKGDIFGYVYIPKNFSKDILLKNIPTVAYGGNASFLLVYGTVVEGIFETLKDFYKDISLAKNMFVKDTSHLMNLSSKSAFNHTLGYVNYVIPAVFILILHQIMLIGVSLQGATQNELKKGYWQEIKPLKLIFVRLLAYFIVYLPICMYYVGFCFKHYLVPIEADVTLLLSLLVLLVFTAVSLGIALGEYMPRKEHATFLVLVSSLPFVFTAGFVWPVELLPQWLNVLVQFYPATPSILAFVELNQMGADFFQIWNKVLQILSLGIGYFLLSLYFLRRKYSGYRNI